jgi:hypothetical protein
MTKMLGTLVVALFLYAWWFGVLEYDEGRWRLEAEPLVVMSGCLPKTLCWEE